MENRFKNANEAFKYFKWQIPEYGVEFDDTQALFNVGFYLENPMDNLIEDEDTGIDFTELILNDTNYKDKLIKYFRRVHKASPTYNRVKTGGTANNKIFTIFVSDTEDNVIATARGKTVKIGQQLASKRALIAMNLIEEEDTESDVE